MEKCICEARMEGECCCGAWNDTAELRRDNEQLTAEIDGVAGALARSYDELSRNLVEMARLRKVYDAAVAWRRCDESPSTKCLGNCLSSLADAVDEATAD